MAFTRPKAAQIDFAVTNISDPLIRINSGQSGSNDKDAGLVIERGDDTNTAIIWDESADSFAVINTSEDGTTSGNVTISSYADLTLKKITQSEQQYTTSNMMKFNQIYTGASAGSYFTQNEYQKILTITPSADSQNYQISGRIMAQSAGSIQIVHFNAALRSETLPALAYSVTYTDQHNGTAFVKPQLWHKQTTTAGFVIAFQYIHNANLYGTVTVDIDVIPRASDQKSNVVMNTTQNSETTSVDAGFTAVDMTKIIEIDGDNVNIAAHDGSADGLELAGTLVTATAAELNILDGVTATATELNYVSGVTSAIQTQIDNISSSFTLAADSGSNDTFTTGQTLTIAGGTGIDTTVSDNNISIAIDSTVATLTGTETLTNKTLTSPSVNTEAKLLAQAELEFYDSDSSNYVSFRGPTTVATNITWTLPNTDGTDGQMLSTNGAGTLSWADGGGGGGSGSSYPNSTFTTVPGTDGDFDMSYNVAQTSQETPFEAGGTDAFGVNLGSVFSCMDPIGTTESIDYADGEAYVGA